MFSKVFTVVLAGALSLVGSIALAETIVNIDMNGRQSDDLTTFPTCSTAGPAGGGSTWNGISVDVGMTSSTVSGSNLLNSYGGSTTVGFSLSNVIGDYNWLWGTNPSDPKPNPGPGSLALFEDYAANGSAVASWTISGLGSITKVDLYFFGMGFQTGGGHVYVGGVHQGTLPGKAQTSSQWPRLHLTDVAVTNGQITGSLTTGTILYGLEVLYVVPEPSTLALLLACGLPGLLCYAWRKWK